MLHTRSLLPLVSNPSQQWQLRALLRLPPELRQIALRNFSSASSLQAEDDVLGKFEEGAGNQSDRNEDTSIIRRVKRGPQWGQNPDVDALVKQFNALDPVKDAKARDVLSKKITQRSAQMTSHALRGDWKSARTNPRPAKAAALSHKRASSSPNDHPSFEPFAESSDIHEGFGALHPGSRRVTLDAKVDQKEGRLSEEELHEWRSAAELSRWHAHMAALQHAVDGLERGRLKARLFVLRQKAEKRNALGLRESELEKIIRRELKSSPTERLLVDPDGSVWTARERGELDHTDKLRRKAKTSAETLRLTGRLSRLRRKAVMRGNILRNHAGFSASKDGSVKSRLAHLKRALLSSPAQVANAPAIQSQLREMENMLRSSLKVSMPHPEKAIQDTMLSTIAGLSQSAILSEGKQAKQRKEARAKEDLPEMSSEDTSRAPTPLPVTRLESEKVEPRPAQQKVERAPAPTNAPADILARPEDVSIFADLRAQIQELTGVIKILVSQQAAGQMTPRTTSKLSQVIDKANDALGAAEKQSSSMSEHALLGQLTGQSRNDTEQDVDGWNQFSELPHELNESRAEVEIDQKSSRQAEAQNSGSELVTQRRVSTAGSSTDSTSAVDSTSSIDELGSLYEQLFPEEAAKSAQSDSSRDDVPRLDLPRNSGGVDSRSTQAANLPEMDDRPIRTVLILRGASKTLTEDDFRRAMPRGRHLQEWTQRGEYERIIPMRDFWTLERTGDYYIIFKHNKAADAFLAHVKRVFDMTKSHTTSSLMSDLPPAPSGLLQDGAEDEAELVRNFTLVAPSMSLHLERMSQGIKAEVLQNGGYPQALAGKLTPETPQVLLEMDGGVMPNWFQLRDAIARDGVRRALPWNLIPGDLAIRKLAMQSSQTDKESEYEATLGDEANELVAAESQSFAFGGEDAMMLAQDRMQNGMNGQRWVVAFREREEAQRFARGWHMRGFPWAEAENKKDKIYRGTTRMKAEVLW